MEKVFEHKGIAASIKVEHNYEAQRRINGTVKHKVILSCPYINYVNAFLVPDKELVTSVMEFQTEIESLIDNHLDPKGKNLDPRLTALGFK
jgi:hypothetical protein